MTDVHVRRRGRGPRALWAVLSACVLLCAALAGAGCAPPGGQGPGGQGASQGPGGRPQDLGLSPEQEYELGAKAYRQIIDKAREKDALLPPDSRQVQGVREVGERIKEAALDKPFSPLLQREINLHLKGYRFNWEFNVIKDDQVNAFCLPGGKVGVFTGLLRIVENKDQLATVLGHEIAHALAHHSNERVTREYRQKKAMEEAKGHMSPFLIGLLSGSAELQGLKYDRQQESEADHIGVFLMTFAGYDPDEAVVFWERMRQASRGGRPPEILSTHPSDARRIQQLRRWVPQAKAALEAWQRHRVVSSR
jgi:predicted Zn-dependent protease